MKFRLLGAAAFAVAGIAGAISAVGVDNAAQAQCTAPVNIPAQTVVIGNNANAQQCVAQVTTTTLINNQTQTAAPQTATNNGGNQTINQDSFIVSNTVGRTNVGTGGTGGTTGGTGTTCGTTGGTTCGVFNSGSTAVASSNEVNQGAVNSQPQSVTQNQRNTQRNAQGVVVTNTATQTANPAQTVTVNTTTGTTGTNGTFDR